MTSRTLAKKVAEFALSKKAYDVLLMDVRKVTGTADFFVICSADSDTQVRAIADAIEQQSKEIGVPVWHMEGFQASTWIILDYVDVVVHVFHRESRSHYNLERLWSDAKTIEVQDNVPLPKVSKKPAATSKPRRSIRRRMKK